MASDTPAFARARFLARGALLLSLLLATMALAHAVGSWPAMPDRVPTHFGASGAPDAWSRKSVAAVFVLPAMALIFGPGIAALALASVGARHVPGPERARLRATLPFVAQFLSGISVLVTVLVAGIAVGANRVALGQAATLGVLPVVGGIGLGAWAVVGSIWLLARHSPVRAPTGPESDPSRWKWGVFYVAPDDPALFVEKRWGGGFTINFGIPAGRRIGFALLAVGLLFLGLGIAAVVAAA